MDTVQENALAEKKKELRQRMRNLRMQQDAAKASASSLAAQKVLLASPLWRKAGSVFLYQATQGEIATDLLFADALASKKSVFFPRVRKNERGKNECGLMDFVEVYGPDDLVPGAYGIMEPHPSLARIAPEDYICDVAVIPGVAFSSMGARLGFGGGFYDRYFARPRARALVGFCYSFQMAEDLAIAPWDVSMTHICTECGLMAV